MMTTPQPQGRCNIKVVVSYFLNDVSFTSVSTHINSFISQVRYCLGHGGKIRKNPPQADDKWMSGIPQLGAHLQHTFVYSLIGLGHLKRSSNM